MYRSIGGHKFGNGSIDDQIMKEIKSIVLGYQLSGGIDAEGELHLWGLKEYSVIPDKYKFGNQ